MSRPYLIARGRRKRRERAQAMNEIRTSAPDMSLPATLPNGATVMAGFGTILVNRWGAVRMYNSLRAALMAALR